MIWWVYFWNYSILPNVLDYFCFFFSVQEVLRINVFTSFQDGIHHHQTMLHFTFSFSCFKSINYYQLDVPSTHWQMKDYKDKPYWNYNPGGDCGWFGSVGPRYQHFPQLENWPSGSSWHSWLENGPIESMYESYWKWWGRSIFQPGAMELPVRVLPQILGSGTAVAGLKWIPNWGEVNPKEFWSSFFGGSVTTLVGSEIFMKKTRGFLIIWKVYLAVLKKKPSTFKTHICVSQIGNHFLNPS